MVEIEPATIVNKNMNMNVHRDRICIVRLIPKGEQQSIYRRVIQNINSYGAILVVVVMQFGWKMFCILVTRRLLAPFTVLEHLERCESGTI
jgi:hypothetical protein